MKVVSPNRRSMSPRGMWMRLGASAFGVAVLLIVGATAASAAPMTSTPNSTSTTSATVPATSPPNSGRSTYSTKGAGANPLITSNGLLATGATINGTGSSFAAPAMSSWVNDVGQSPYNLGVGYASSNSGQGRFEFTNQTTDYAVSDIGYVGNTDTTPPSFPFNFIPITAGGIAFMYHVPGLNKPLQLTSFTACALLTGGIKNWNDPALAGDNPGASLPALAVVPVTESDSAGTNYVLEEWCIAEQPALWAAFSAQQHSQSGGPTDGVAISATSPNSNWPGIQGGLDDQNTTAVAGDVATTAGAMGAVQVKYANDEAGFNGSDPSKGVALVKNTSGQFAAPTPVDVSSALAYATQQANGTHVLNFNGVGPHVYNPSTYSYLLTPTTGWSPAKGQTMSEFVNFVLTLGQQAAPTFGYATLGLSLEQYGINAVTTNVPGSVAPTAAEKAAYQCGDLTPAAVAKGQTTPTCGDLNQTAGLAKANSGTATGAGGSGSSLASNGSGTGADPGVSLSGASGLPNTGGDPLPLTLLGLLLVAVGWIGRRIFLHTRPRSTR